MSNKVICVLGSGRCGSSMITRALNFLGVDLGTNFLPKDKTNPKGFWEDLEIVMNQRKLLLKFRTPILVNNWHKDPFVRPIKQRLKYYIHTHFSKKKIWGWKDPRTCECLPMWKEILSELNISPYYLIIIRNPIDVSFSFNKHYKANEGFALDKWQGRNLLALKETFGENRLIIDYDHFLNDSIGCLKKISKAFDIPWPKDEDKLKSQLSEFIDLRLQHSKAGIENLLKKNIIDSDIKTLYLECMNAVKSPEILNSPKFHSTIEKLYQNYIRKRKQTNPNINKIRYRYRYRYTRQFNKNNFRKRP